MKNLIYKYIKIIDNIRSKSKILQNEKTIIFLKSDHFESTDPF